MKKILVLLILFNICPLFGQVPTGDDILKKVDQNLSADSKIIVSKMIIHGRRGSRTVESKTWMEGEDQSFTEYLSPARERGTKMLKLEDQLWLYSPQTDRTIKISGHMLRQSVMGSDLSYEDMMEDPELHKIYSATLLDSDTLNNRECYVLKLEARKEDIAYHSRKIWVDKERYIPIKEERFAKSGKLLKSTTIDEVMRTDNRWIAKKITFKDELKVGKGTEFIIESIMFNQDIPDYIFSKAALRK